MREGLILSFELASLKQRNDILSNFQKDSCTCLPHSIKIKMNSYLFLLCIEIIKHLKLFLNFPFIIWSIHFIDDMSFFIIITLSTLKLFHIINNFY